MKISLMQNDRSTVIDEVVLGLITVLSAAFGSFLVVVKPSVWIISGENIASFGVFFIVLAVMYFPCLIYRVFENDSHNLH